MANDKKKNKKVKIDAETPEVVESEKIENEAEETAQQQSVDESIKKLEEEKNSYLELCQRTRAEFENYKKRNATLRADSLDGGVREAVTALLPVIDNLERALDVDAEHDSTKAVKEGVQMTVSQMLGVLESLGLEEIRAEGEVFDPNFHHAVMQGEADEDYPEETIMEVFQKGYKLRGRIIRHSMVKVAK
jgi:molecular chaperone GrpE